MENENGNGGNSYYHTIDAFISDSELMLNNTLTDNQIKALMNNAGYTSNIITAKLVELDSLRTLNEAQAQQYGEQDQATNDFLAAKADYHRTYTDHLGLARLALRKNVEAQETLGLRGGRKTTYSGYIGQGLLFYNNAVLPGKPYAAALAAKGVDAAALAAGAAHFQSLQTDLEAQQKETGEAQQATATRDTLYDALEDWMYEYRGTARIILRPYPQLAEELGIKDPSGGGNGE